MASKKYGWRLGFWRVEKVRIMHEGLANGRISWGLGFICLNGLGGLNLSNGPMGRDGLGSKFRQWVKSEGPQERQLYTFSHLRVGSRFVENLKIFKIRKLQSFESSFQQYITREILKSECKHIIEILNWH